MSKTNTMPMPPAARSLENGGLSLQILDSSKELRVLDTPQMAYLLVEIRPPESARPDQQTLPLNLAIVIDRSTSMVGERLKKIKQAAALVVEKMTSVDHLAIVTYSDRAEVLVPAGPVSNAVEVTAKIQSIRPSGGTETLQGVLTGMKELAKAPLERYISHLILLTDGHTYGDADACLQVAARAAERGIGISAFGIGSEWNDDFLDALVSPSGGQSGFIEEPEQIIHLLRERIQHLGVVYAQNVHLEIPQLDPAVRLKDAYKITPFAQPIDIHQKTMNLGAVEGKTPLSFLLELFLESTHEQPAISIPLNLSADISGQEKLRVSLQRQHEILIEPGLPPGKMPEKLMEAVRLLNLNRMNEKVWTDVHQGNIDGATRKMALLSRRLDEAGLHDLAQTALAGSLDLQKGLSLPEDRRMKLKYGTRMQLTNSLTLMFHGSQGLET